jgi:hypothetical protein
MPTAPFGAIANREKSLGWVNEAAIVIQAGSLPALAYFNWKKIPNRLYG